MKRSRLLLLSLSLAALCAGCTTPAPPPALAGDEKLPPEALGAYWRQDEAFPQALAVARSGTPSPTPELDALADLAANTTPELGLEPLLEPGGGAAPTVRLLPGDLIEVVVYEREEFSGKRRVGPDGTVPLFMIGALRLEGLTEVEASSLVATALRKQIKHAQVQVWIEKPAGQKAELVGRVREPGTKGLPTERRLSVVGLLGLGGGLDEDADGKRLALIRRDDKGRQRVYHFTHDELVQAHLSGREAFIQPKDELIVPRLPDVHVYGAVKEPGTRPLRRKTTVASLLQSAGGLDEGANAREIQIMRGEILEGAELERVLEPGHVVFVPSRQRVYAVGRGVRENGPIDLPSTGLTVIQAIAEAGWFTKRADRDSVEILRYRGGRQTRIEVPIDEILEGTVKESDYTLQPGDLIRVSEELF